MRSRCSPQLDVAVLGVIVGVLAACDRSQPIVICHNSNCVGNADPDDDDTLESLAAALDHVTDGRPTIDGVELDTIWHRTSNACLFEHGPGEELPQDTTADATALIAAHLAKPDVAWNGERFHVVVELKRYVGSRFDEHTADELLLHTECALDIYDSLVAARGSHRLQIVFEAEPHIVDVLRARPRWPGRSDGDVEVRVAAEAGAPWDEPIGNYREIDIVEYQPSWTPDGQLEAFHSIGAELCTWSYTSTPEVLHAIERHEPRYVLTSEAAMLRGWLTR